jgi:hypothetical protein
VKFASRNERVALSAEDRCTSIKLKSLGQLADEFVRLVSQIDRNGDGPLFDAALEPLLADPSFVDLAGQGREELFGDDLRNSFMCALTTI